MKRIYLITCLLLLCAYAHAQTAWNKIIDFCPGTDRASNSAAQLADDDIILVAGNAKTNSILDRHCYIAALDYNGTLTHSKQLDFLSEPTFMSPYTSYFSPHFVAKISDNKYVFTAVEFNRHANNKIEVCHPFFYIFDKKCDSIRFVKYTDTIVSRVPYCITTDAQKNILVTGLESSRSIYFSGGSSFSWDSGYVWFAKYDSNANLLWSKKLWGHHNYNFKPDGGVPIGIKVVVSADQQSYLLAASVYDETNKKFRVILANTDLNVNIIWQRFIPVESWSNGIFDIISLKQGGYAFACTHYIQIGYPDTYFGKMDEQGDTLWTKRINKTNTANEGEIISEAENEDLILLTQVTYNGIKHPTVIRTTPKGNIKWYREYKHIDTNLFLNEISAMSYTPTRQVLLSGRFYCGQPTPGIFDTVGQYSWFVLTDTFGCIEPGCQVGDTMWWLTDVNEIAARQVAITIYPNPATNIVYIQVGNTPKKLNAVLRDMSGHTLSTAPLQSNGKTPVDIAHLPQGLYMLEVWDETGRIKVFKVEHY